MSGQGEGPGSREGEGSRLLVKVGEGSSQGPGSRAREGSRLLVKVGVKVGVR